MTSSWEHRRRLPVMVSGEQWAIEDDLTDVQPAPADKLIAN